MSPYIPNLKDWPRFRWDKDRLTEPLAAVRYRQGRLYGRMGSLDHSLRAEAVLRILTLDVLRSNELEGELLDAGQICSCIAQRLEMTAAPMSAAIAPVSANRYVKGIVDLSLDSIQGYDKLLTEDRLYGWHAAYFPTGYSGINKIRVGAWRDNEKGQGQAMAATGIHFEAPGVGTLRSEMKKFLNWFNSRMAIDPAMKAAILHIWFVTIDPFDDGNDRIARAIADMQLARSDGSGQRFYSLSAAILQERDMYYRLLEQARKGSLDITAWLEWWLACLDRALTMAEETLTGLLKKAGFLDKHMTTDLNERQRVMINKALDGLDGLDGFNSRLSTSQWARIAGCSPDTALRDIQDLVSRGALIKDVSGGRSTGYLLKEPSQP